MIACTKLTHLAIRVLRKDRQARQEKGCCPNQLRYSYLPETVQQMSAKLAWAKPHYTEFGYSPRVRSLCPWMTHPHQSPPRWWQDIPALYASCRRAATWLMSTLDHLGRCAVRMRPAERHMSRSQMASGPSCGSGERATNKVQDFTVPLSIEAQDIIEQQSADSRRPDFTATRADLLTSRGMKKHLGQAGKWAGPHGFPHEAQNMGSGYRQLQLMKMRRRSWNSIPQSVAKFTLDRPTRRRKTVMKAWRSS